MDLSGPISATGDSGKERAPTIGGSEYALFVVDECSRYTFTTLLASKADAADAIINLLVQLHTKFGYYPTEVHSDNGTEFCNKRLASFFTTCGITHATPYTPALNGLVERTNGILFNAARSMITHANLPSEYWGEALMAATYTRNLAAPCYRQCYTSAGTLW